MPLRQLADLPLSLAYMQAVQDTLLAEDEERWQALDTAWRSTWDKVEPHFKHEHESCCNQVNVACTLVWAYSPSLFPTLEDSLCTYESAYILLWRQLGHTSSSLPVTCSNVPMCLCDPWVMCRC